MGLFRKRKINNVAEAILPPSPPASTTIHNHGTSWPWIIITSVICALISMPVLWLFLVHLFGQLGYRRPQQQAAWWILAIPVFLITVWILGWLADKILSGVRGIVVDIQHEITERKRIELLAIQSQVDPGRMTEADYQFAQVVLAVMNEAYAYIQKYDAPFKGRGRPWSVRSVLDAAKAMDISITQVQAGEVVKWLRTNSVVIGALDGQVNVGEYPDLGKVRALIDSKFGRPITVNKYPPLRENWGYQHI